MSPQIYEFLARLVHGCARACCGQREPRRSAFSDGCGGFRQALGLAVASAHHLTITRMELAPARCEPFLVNSLLPGPSTCPAWLSVAPVPSRCEPVPVFPLPPGPSTCPAWPSVASTPARCEPFSTNRLTPSSRDSGSGPGAMAAGAQEQAASCDAFVLSRRQPAPGAPPIRTSPTGLIAKAPSNSRRTTARSRAGTAAANSVGLGQGHHRWTAFWPWAT